MRRFVSSLFVLTALGASPAPASPSAPPPIRDGRPADAAPDTLPVYAIDEIVVVRARADRTHSAVPYSELDGAAIRDLHHGQDVPMVVAAAPSAYAYSDAGNGYGYTYLRIRGFEQSRIGMRINGVPINDPESHQVYWVDHGDVLSDARSVHVQRGIGTTLFGQSGFGGSVDVQTSPLAVVPGVHLDTGYVGFTDGSIDTPTRTYRAALATGPMLDGRVALYGRYSTLDGEGYREGAKLDQESFALSALYAGRGASHKIDLLSGRELTHFAWDGISPDAPVRPEDLRGQPCHEIDLDDRDDRRCNRYAIYPNNVDSFRQVIGSLTSEREIGERTSLSNTVYFVNGEGFFEQFELDEPFFDYGLEPITVDSTTIESTDLVRRRWLDNRYWGVLPQLRLPIGARGRASLGLGVRHYEAAHFGELVWTDADVDAPPLDRYYDYDTTKLSFEAYARAEIPVFEATVVTGALQYQGHRYDFTQRSIGNFRGYSFEADHDFLSPRLGVRQRIGPPAFGLSAYGSVSYARREPAETDYIDGDDPSSVPAFRGANTRTKGLDDPIVKPESLVDVELGAEIARGEWRVAIGLYQLELRDELIPIDGGRIEEEGRLARANAERTRHQGVELEAAGRLHRGVTIAGNVSVARHRFVDHEIFAYWLDDYAGGLLRLDGRTIPRSPGVLAHLRTRWEDPAIGRTRLGGVVLGAELRHAGKQYIDGENVEANAIDPHTLVNLSATIDMSRAIGFTRALVLDVRVLNVFDTRYETFGYSYYDDFPVRQLRFYWPGATRSLFVGLRVVL